MNAIELLISDHDRIREIFDQLEASDDPRNRKRLFREVRRIVDLHSEVEETIFYPNFQDMPGVSDIIREAYEEHQDIRDLLDEMEASLEDDVWEVELDELITCLDSHFEEEEAELFPKIEENATESELRKLAERIQNGKRIASEAA